MSAEQKKLLKNLAFIAVVTILAVWFNLSNEEAESSKSDVGGFQGNFILALSWQPAFCEKSPNKPECRSMHEGRFDTQNFVLHGLWPQPKDNIYCGSRSSSGRWSNLPKLDISNALRSELEQKMPGYRSYLHRHEWEKHGTCSKVTPELYFRTSLDLLDAINATSLKDYAAQNIGRNISLDRVASIMDSNLGRGAGKRISFFCNRDGRRNLVSEIWFSLSATSGNLKFTDNILNAPVLNSSCKAGIIDPVGLQ